MATTKGAIKQTLTVKPREQQGSRAARRLRLQGLVPGVVYGRSVKPISVLVNQREISKFLRSSAGEHSVLTLRLEGEKAWEKPALVEDVQHHPVDGQVIHIDFRAITLTERLRVPVAVELVGEPIGVKQDGGILEHFLREVEVECLPTEIPAHITYDVSNLTIGQNVHVRDLAVPPGAKILTDPEGTIAAVQKRREEKPEEAVAAVTEPEVIREKKEKAEGEEEAGAAKEKGEAKPEEKAKK